MIEVVSPMNIVVLHSGTASAVLRRTLATREWEGYYENAASISEALRVLGHFVTVASDGIGLIPELIRHEPDLAWICSGGIQGRDQTCHLPAILESLGVAYVGSPPLSAGMADNKAIAKAMISAAGIPTPRSITVDVNGLTPELDFPFPVVVKPSSGLCSCGVMKVDDQPTLTKALAKLHRRYQSTVLIESYVDGLDISIPVLQRDSLVALPPLQRQFQWDTSQTSPVWSRPHPASEMLEGPATLADLPTATRQLLSEAAVSACSALGIRHFARVDFRLDGSRGYFLEANHKPDLTRESLFARSAAAAGIAYETLVQSILDVASRDSRAVDFHEDSTAWHRRGGATAGRRAS